MSNSTSVADLLSKRKNRIHTYYAVDQDNHPVSPFDKSACRFSVLGGIYRIYGLGTPASSDAVLRMGNAIIANGFDFVFDVEQTIINFDLLCGRCRASRYFKTIILAAI